MPRYIVGDLSWTNSGPSGLRLPAGTDGRMTPTYPAHSYVLPELLRPGRRIVLVPSPGNGSLA